MTKINYNEDNFKNIRERVEECNKEIIDSLTNIYKEVSDIETILNTPKSKDIIPLYNDYIENRIDYFNEKNNDYKNSFYYIINSYETYYNDVKKMMGENDD
jgi:hypothetical protein